ncbi:MAG: M13 family metallopeptidase [Sphingomonas sp.]|jgi:predicted metalloendopeptidase|uniref:M13 family metallopeptidase n=1 Tax=Sphingomonas sp. TaxID=28214 RepID=UPI0035697D55
MFEISAKVRNGAATAICAMLVVSMALAGVSADIGIDPSVRPGDDFYRYANGAWLSSTRLPDGTASIDSSAMLRALNAQRVRALIDDAVTHPRTPTDGKIADYYTTRLDGTRIETKGLTPLSGDLAAIAAITDRRALASYLGHTLRLDDGSNQQTESLLGIWVHQGFHDPYHYAAHLVQGGLGLSDKSDYLVAGQEQAARLTLYRAHIANMLRLGGFDQPETRAARVLTLETAIAATHASRADTDDVFKTDNDWRRADFINRAPGMDWPAYFSSAGLGPATRFVVWQPRAVIGGAQLVATQPLDAWKDYFVFHLIEHYAAVLPHAIDDERRAFEARIEGATPSSAPARAPRALAATQAAFGDAIGRRYVERYFPAHAKATMTAMVENIRIAWRAHLIGLTWMSPVTKTKALSKLAALRIGLGYPKSWVDYAPLVVVRDDAFGNLRRVEAFTYRREIAKLRRTVDPDEWAGGLHPQMVGAVLDISPNRMEFAAGLLQPPYFDPTGDAAANYGSAGAGIAHEIGHSFDELGNLYDAQGRLGRWWTSDDVTRYRAVADQLATQLDACGHGKRVLGESAVDIAGLTVAHDAYLLSLHDKPDTIKQGLTGEQRFFIAFAQRWRKLQTDAAARQQFETDTHAPPPCRGNLVRNVAAWTRAFHVVPGDKLYLKPKERVLIW